ncbi:carboxypeptidase-like regulatory domain-containing protein [Echinimonas agarilytica]|uniref:Carboxypeptidase-like regulatory domain-containing protein n=1 Tax=Echinimonas agarilytica TaxID=1215918 RepID=A0AA42B7E5_9GAMM|nr:carboxypeptidase-like regulatory domain-containing protein [Echinimonas agarilytica]MCM2679178.1 carboxypeptidase-like regulatory domain-containing protein [Echinimonas agarilytica]
MPTSYAAEAIEGWDENSQLEVSLSNPSRNRRSPDATVDITLKNNGDADIAGPVRVFVTDLSPASVSLSDADGQESSTSYFMLVTPSQTLKAGESAQVRTVTVAGGGRVTFDMKAKAYIPTPPKSLIVDITSPNTLLTVGTSPVSVSGTINNELAALTLNGVPVSHTNGQFMADVELEEGFNSIVARATTSAGEQVTDSISVSLDMTPPYLTVDSHIDGAIVYTETITVTGLVNDIVRGTIESEQAKVQVNGIDAIVSNRSYSAQNIKLSEGQNTVEIVGVDETGNRASISFAVQYKKPLGRRLVLISGQDQTANIGDILPTPLTVQVVNDADEPVVGESIVFRVMQGSGIVGVDTPNVGRAVVVSTNDSGLASTKFQLGARTGVSNHKVKAAAVGYDDDVIFNASANSVVADKISVNSGNNQRGMVNQALPAPFVVAVTDNGANTVKGARVRYEVITGDGVFQNGESSFETITDSDGRASAQLTLGELEGLDAQKVEAILIDSPIGVQLLAGFSATAFAAADAGNTSVSGVVLDNQDTPLPNVTVRIEDTDRLALTDSQGRFVIEQAPVGPVHIIVDGSTTTVRGEFPTLSYHLVTVAGVDNPMSSPVYMVKLDTLNGKMAGREDIVLTLDNYPGFKLEVAKDSVTFPDGSREGIVSVTAVNASKVPMAPPNGMQPQFIVTIQPVGATFSPAAKLTLPNVDGHAPGAQVEMYSFDHDLEEFVSIGLGSVSEDGSVVSSNPGVGVVKAGWHCGSQPGGSGTAHNCPTCQKCEGSSCVRDPAQDNNERPADQQTPGDCKTNLCKGNRAEPGDIPQNDVQFDCRKPGCEGDKPVHDVPDDNDISEDDKKCSTCSGGDKIVDKDKEGAKCSGGDTTKACYTCKKGSCGNHCDASSVTKKYTTTAPAGFDKIISGFVDKVNAVPQVVMSYGGVAISGYVIEGEHCCTDCSKGLNAVPYQITGGEVGGNATITAAGAGIAVNIGPKYFAGFQVKAKVVLSPLAGEAVVALSGKGESEKVSTCQEADCSEVSIQAGVNLAVGAIGDVSGKVEYCDTPSDCDIELFSARGRAEATGNLAIQLKGNTFLGESCPAGDISADIGKFSLLVRALVSGSVGLYSFEEEIKKELVLYEGI